MAEYSLYVKFTSELFVNGTISLPNLLLSSYKKLGLNETELVLLIHLWRFQQEEDNRYPTPKDLSDYMTTPAEEIQDLLAGLIEKKIISVEHIFEPNQQRWVDRFSFAGLFDQLMEVWALLKAQQLEQEKQSGSQLSAEVAQSLFQTFEEEFGRLLSPFESNQILEWCYEDKYSPDLVMEALRKASLRGIKNLKYIDSILADWSKHNITTLEEVERYEQQFQARQQAQKGLYKGPGRKEEEIKKKIDKYKDVYMS